MTLITDWCERKGVKMWAFLTSIAFAIEPTGIVMCSSGDRVGWPWLLGKTDAPLPAGE